MAIRQGTGGLIGENTRSQSQNTPTRQKTDTTGQQDNEGYIGQAIRNVVQSPWDILKFIAGAGGLADLSSSLPIAALKAYKGTGEDVPQEIQNQLKNQTISMNRPDVKQLEKQILPEYLQEKPSDWFYKQAIPQLALTAATAGGSSIPQLLKGAATTAGVYGGSKLGGMAGHAIGEDLRKGGGDLGEILGGLGGGYAGANLTQRALNRPTQIFPEKVNQKNINAELAQEAGRKSEFETGKQERLNKLESEYIPKVKQLTEELKNDPYRIAKDVEAFEKIKKKDIKALHNEFKKKQASLEKKQQKRSETIENLGLEAEPLYKKSKPLAKKIKISSPEIQEIVDSTGKNIGLGFTETDQHEIGRILNQLESVATKPESTLLDVITFKENNNSRLRDLNAYVPGQEHRTALSRTIKKIQHGLNQYIKKEGKKHPDFYKDYAAAEKNIQKKGSLLQKKSVQEFKESQKKQLSELKENFNREISEVKATKYPEERNIYNKQTANSMKKDLGIIEKDYKKAQEAIGKETYQKLVSTESKDAAFQQKTIDKIVEAGAKVGSNWGLATLSAGIMKMFGIGNAPAGLAFAGAKLGREVYRELKYASEVFRDHPEIYAESMDIIKQLIKKETPKLLLQLNELGNKIEKLSSAKEEKSKKKVYGIRPGTGGLI